MPDQTCIFQIRCRGRKAPGVEVLKRPVNVKLEVRQRGDGVLLSVRCKHNTGSHGQRCKASHPNVDKVGEGVLCPYSLDIPHCLDAIRF
jgi:hypothetical protein